MLASPSVKLMALRRVEVQFARVCGYSMIALYIITAMLEYLRPFQFQPAKTLHPPTVVVKHPAA